MSAPATHEALSAMLDAMRAAGLKPLAPIAAELLGGRLVRFACEGDNPRRPNGWARFHGGLSPAGAFGHWRLDISERWRWRGPALSAADRERVRREADAARERRRAEQAAEHCRAAGAARALWNAAEPTTAAHPYLARKRLSGAGLRASGGVLLAPMVDSVGRLWNVQRIDRDGTKRFLSGGRTAGLLLPLGFRLAPDAPPPDRLCIAEGVATTMAVREASGWAAASVYSSSNLEAGALALRARFPACDLIVCADDDAANTRNIGLEKATAAARAAGARLALPRRRIAA